MYNQNNVFAKIIRGEITTKKIYEDDDIISFYDINPKAKVHALVIPKKHCLTFVDFILNSSNHEVGRFFQKVQFIATDILKLENFKLLTNNGEGAGQEIPHFHIHILGN
jgi:histidine triad (HIT) family protein